MVTVRHAGGSYPVVIEIGAISQLPTVVAEWLPGRRIVAITDRNVARAIDHDLKVPVLVIPPGEGSKTRRRWSDLTDQLLALGFGRDSGLVAIGGGVVGDLAGFVAATFQRGVPYVQVPTSLLAMVDASVGGKTGVNTHHGKNLVGAFHPPVGVLIDPSAVRTLRSPHLRGGLVEAIKHGIVADAAYLDWIDAHQTRLLARDPEILRQLVRRSVEIKATIVGADEREGGRRAILNAGHTIGHALEWVSGYRRSHGDAIALGLVIEARIATRLDLVPAGAAAAMAERFAGLGVPLDLPAAGEDDGLIEAMTRDKKSRAGALRFALPRAPGALIGLPEWTTEVPVNVVRQALGDHRAAPQPPFSTPFPHPDTTKE